MVKSSLPEVVEITSSNGETFSVAIRLSARTRNAKLQLINGNFELVLPKDTNASQLNSYLPQTKAFVEKHADKAKEFLGIKATSDDADEPLPAHFDYTVEDGRTFRFLVQRNPRIHNAKYVIQNGYLLLQIPKKNDEDGL